jgi:hypothetical protein
MLRESAGGIVERKSLDSALLSERVKKNDRTVGGSALATHFIISCYSFFALVFGGGGCFFMELRVFRKNK